MAQHYPKSKDIIAIAGQLSRMVPMDTPFQMGWRRSVNDVPNFRVKTQTKGRAWMVDIYNSDYLVVTVSDRLAEVCTSVPSAVKYLSRMLDL